MLYGTVGAAPWWCACDAPQNCILIYLVIVCKAALAHDSFGLSSQSLCVLWLHCLLRALATLQSVFGQPATFTPTTTHVLLVAIIIVLIVHSQRR